MDNIVYYSLELSSRLDKDTIMDKSITLTKDMKTFGSMNNSWYHEIYFV